MRSRRSWCTTCSIAPGPSLRTNCMTRKMVSLGKLSAGLAHELNNPASAIERGAKLLGERLAESEQAARVLGAARLSDAQLASVDAAREFCTATRAQGVRSPIEEAEREEAIADWLTDHGLDVALAEELAETTGDTRSARRAGRVRGRTGIGGRAALGRRRMLGPRPGSRRFRKPRGASSAWSPRSRASRTWIRERLPDLWTWRKA